MIFRDLCFESSMRVTCCIPAAGPAGGPTTVPDGGRPAVTAMDG